MRRMIIIALLLTAVVLGLYLGPELLEYDGYILIVMEGGTLQLSVFGFLLSLIAITLGGWATFILGRYSFRAITGSSKWLSGLSSRRRKLALTNGLTYLFSEDFESAKTTLKKIENHDFDGINLLAAAQAENSLGNVTSARELWHQASQYKPSFIAATVALCRSYLATDESSKALQLIGELPEKHHNEPVVVKTWALCLESARKWSELKERLPKWKKPLGKEFVVWQQKTAKGTFAEIASKEGAIELKKNWKSLPRASRKDVGQQAAYIQLLIEQGMHNDAEDLLIEYQKNNPLPQLLPLFRQLRLPNPSATIKKLEGWIKQDDTNGELYSILGHVAYYAKDNILAEKALSKAIKLTQQQQDILLLANLKEAQQDEHQALVLYKKSLTER